MSNLLFVDQPTGTGFSYTSDDKDIRHNEQGVSNDLYDFLQVNQNKDIFTTQQLKQNLNFHQQTVTAIAVILTCLISQKVAVMLQLFFIVQ